MRIQNVYFIASIVAMISVSVSHTDAATIYSENFSGLALGGALAVADSNSQIGSGQYYSLPSNALSNLNWTGSGQGIYAWQGQGETGVLLNEDGNPSNPATISTTIGGLTVGAAYTLSFHFWGDNIPGDQYYLLFQINGSSTTIGPFTDLNPSVPAYTATYGFIANATSTQLLFQELTPPGNEGSPIVSDIVVATSAVPEPSTAALVGFGGLGLALGAWRRRRAAAAV